jgi:hypothetical protein
MVASSLSDSRLSRDSNDFDWRFTGEVRMRIFILSCVGLYGVLWHPQTECAEYDFSQPPSLSTSTLEPSRPSTIHYFPMHKLWSFCPATNPWTLADRWSINMGGVTSSDRQDHTYICMYTCKEATLFNMISWSGGRWDEGRPTSKCRSSPTAVNMELSQVRILQPLKTQILQKPAQSTSSDLHYLQDLQTFQLSAVAHQPPITSRVRRMVSSLVPQPLFRQPASKQIPQTTVPTSYNNQLAPDQLQAHH